jgi:hypothetical protein
MSEHPNPGATLCVSAQRLSSFLVLFARPQKEGRDKLITRKTKHHKNVVRRGDYDLNLQAFHRHFVA